jgi:hypothetical protein
MLAFVLADGVRTPLVGRVSPNGAFDLRRPRSFGTPPRVIVLRGHVRASGAGAEVVARFGFHPVVRVAFGVLVLFFLMLTAVLAPAIPGRSEVLSAILAVALTVVAFCAPLFWLGRYDRVVLRTELEAALREAGPVTLVGA